MCCGGGKRGQKQCVQLECVQGAPTHTPARRGGWQACGVVWVRVRGAGGGGGRRQPSLDRNLSL